MIKQKTIINGVVNIDRLEQVVKDISTRNYYDRMVPFEDDLVREAMYGTRIWKSELEPDPYERLAYAVINFAVADYVEARATGNPMIIHQSERWFRQNEFTENVLDGVRSICRVAEKEPGGLYALRRKMKTYL